MTGRKTDKGRELALRARPRDYDVGYGKPPGATRFKQGQSGNRRGRPPGSRKGPPALNEERLKSIVLEEAYRTVSVNDANGSISIPMVQAVVRSLAVNAAKGNQRAQRLFTQLLAATERENKRLHDEWLQTAIEYKVEWERELERRKKLGIEAADPVPHPDHVNIDVLTGTVRITGPMTKADKAVWDQLRARKHESGQEIVELQDLLTKDPDHQHRDQILADIKHAKRIRDVISKAIPD